MVFFFMELVNSSPWFFDGPNRNRWFMMVYDGLPIKNGDFHGLPIKVSIGDNLW